MTIEANDARRGMILRRTRNAGAIYYTAPVKSAGETPDAWRAYYKRRLEPKRRTQDLNGRDRYTLERIEDGWVPLLRHRRYRDADGNRCESKELTAIPPDYALRVVKTKPGWP